MAFWAYPEISVILTVDWWFDSCFIVNFKQERIPDSHTILGFVTVSRFIYTVLWNNLEIQLDPFSHGNLYLLSPFMTPATKNWFPRTKSIQRWPGGDWDLRSLSPRFWAPLLLLLLLLLFAYFCWCFCKKMHQKNTHRPARKSWELLFLRMFFGLRWLYVDPFWMETTTIFCVGTNKRMGKCFW